ncbi:DUF2147 domain-containing protein [Acinetobacter guillouiae]|uniref:hypothetical protein n=1 Tax=Acinetobacter guillouiae TaxID=106649 RepID=UPI001CD32357|nr:hypothetical protein [Acinetobacter guillouiae]
MIWFLVFQLHTSTSWANEIQGQWKTIDDKSGFPRAIITIQKEQDSQKYYGKIDKIYSLPNGINPIFDKCAVCKGDLKINQ